VVPVVRCVLPEGLTTTTCLRTTSGQSGWLAEWRVECGGVTSCKMLNGRLRVGESGIIQICHLGAYRWRVLSGW